MLMQSITTSVAIDHLFREKRTKKRAKLIGTESDAVVLVNFREMPNCILAARLSTRV